MKSILRQHNESVYSFVVLLLIFALYDKDTDLR